MLISRKRLTQLLGLLWLIDGILQLQPQMFTMNMVNGVMRPMLDGQPAVVESSLNWIVQVTTQNLILVNLIVAIVQILFGLSLLLDRGVKVALLASIVWSFIVWYGGEGMSMLLTGQAGAITGAPGAVLLYALLALVVYPYAPTSDPDEGGILSRKQLRWALAIFWIFMALLQVQPYWWQDGQISQAISAMVGQGGFNGFLVDPFLQWLSNITSSIEIPLNVALIVVFLALGIALFFIDNRHIRPVLVVSIVVSLIIWYGAEAFGMIFTGMATDFNSGLLLVVIALACWPLAHARISQRRKYMAEVRGNQRQSQRTAQTV
ncbi:MAG TPA: hypothetical protein VKU38_15080 [Ktedonobacteraceae bacterium]|nr:hypothetical protein [Ktedonobacteraceae bacterium]